MNLMVTEVVLDTVGERGKGSNPPQEITSKHQGHLVSGTSLSRLASGPDLPHYSDPLAPKSLCG